MLQIIHLNPLEVEQVDPYKVGRKWMGTHFSSDCFNEPSPLFKGSRTALISDYVSRFCDISHAGKHLPIVEYDLEMSKKTGPQGGKATWETAKDTFKSYYENADIVPSYRLAIEGRDLLISWIKSVSANNALPPIDHSWLEGPQAAGMSRGGTKNWWLSHADGLKFNYTPGDPVLPNIRKQRNKVRAIFCTSAKDNDALQPPLTACREWLKQHFPHIFGAWLNPTEYTYPDITTGVIRNSWFLETDFKAMDQHLTWAVVRDIILPIYEVLLPEWEYLYFYAKVEEAYHAPLFIGTDLWTGLHTTFSGQSFTNDFETLVAVCVYLAAHVRSGQPIATFGEQYKGIGDDVVYRADSKAQLMAVYNLVRYEFKRIGLILSEEKTRIQQGECRFCRMVYYSALPRYLNANNQPYVWPAYPMVLAINNCIQPERTHSYVPEELMALFTRLDNGKAHYQFNNIVNWLYGKFSPNITPATGNLTDVAFTELQMKDWWYKVYNTTYTLSDSPSAAIYRQRFQRK